jgi:hypothetical protein
MNLGNTFVRIGAKKLLMAIFQPIFFNFLVEQMTHTLLVEIFFWSKVKSNGTLSIRALGTFPIIFFRKHNFQPKIISIEICYSWYSYSFRIILRRNTCYDPMP